MTLSPFQQVLSEVTEADRAIVTLYASWLINTDPWRPSDAARAAVRLYRESGLAAVERRLGA